MEKYSIGEIAKRDRLPANLGWDPFNAWRWLCKRCGSEGTIFEKELDRGDRRKGLVKGQRVARCKACRHGHREVVYKLDRRRAFHLNDIRHRRTTVKGEGAVHGF